MHLVSTEFLLKPARYLRGALNLLQSTAETTAWEFSPDNAPPVPFAAEVHRWAHVGAMDLASKVVRTATGFYARGDRDVEAKARERGPSPEMADLCGAVRRTEEGAAAVPWGVIIGVVVLVGVALLWWALERLGGILAGMGFSGPWGVVRGFLMLSAATPVGLAVSVEMALAGGKVVGSGSGLPLLEGEEKAGPSLEQEEEGRWILRWGVGGTGAGRERIKIQ